MQRRLHQSFATLSAQNHVLGMTARDGSEGPGNFPENAGSWRCQALLFFRSRFEQASNFRARPCRESCVALTTTWIMTRTRGTSSGDSRLSVVS